MTLRGVLDVVLTDPGMARVVAAAGGAGLAVTVPHAIPEAKQFSHYVTKREGGHGAVREVIDMILKAQGKWDKLVAFFAQ